MAKQEGEKLEIQKEGNAYFITLKKDQILGSLEKIKLFYKGNPREAWWIITELL